MIVCALNVFGIEVQNGLFIILDMKFPIMTFVNEVTALILMKLSLTDENLIRRPLFFYVRRWKISFCPWPGIIILNIMSWGSGANAWGPEKEDKFTKPNHWDGMLEVVGVQGVVHLGQIQSGLRSAIRIVQVSWWYKQSVLVVHIILIMIGNNLWNFDEMNDILSFSIFQGSFFFNISIS